jgi:glycosyltransferase involved in cell wall biosynthesis
LKALAESLSLGPEAVQWLGQVPQARLFELYRGAHCLLFPSLHDSSGNVVLEAQAHGCPVVCLDCGGPAVLLGPGAGIAVAIRPASEDAVVERLADALARLAADEPARLAMAVAAHRHALQWSWRQRVLGCLEMLGYPAPAAPDSGALPAGATA